MDEVQYGYGGYRISWEGAGIYALGKGKPSRWALNTIYLPVMTDKEDHWFRVTDIDFLENAMKENRDIMYLEKADIYIEAPEGPHG